MFMYTFMCSQSGALCNKTSAISYFANREAFLAAAAANKHNTFGDTLLYQQHPVSSRWSKTAIKLAKLVMSYKAISNPTMQQREQEYL